MPNFRWIAALLAVNNALTKNIPGAGTGYFESLPSSAIVKLPCTVTRFPIAIALNTLLRRRTVLRTIRAILLPRSYSATTCAISIKSVSHLTSRASPLWIRYAAFCFGSDLISPVAFNVTRTQFGSATTGTDAVLKGISARL